jgi:hypothetical protein
VDRRRRLRDAGGRGFAAPPIAAALRDASGSYGPAFLFFIAVLAAAAILRGLRVGAARPAGARAAAP